MKKILSTLILAAIFNFGCGTKLTLKAVKATRTAVESSVNTTSSGTVTAEQQAILNFGIVGRINRINVKGGETVKAGHVLAELENTDFKTVLEDAVRGLRRAQELFDSGLVSRSALDEARKGYEIARANLDKTIIKAPFEGMITEQNLELGELSQITPSTGKAPLRIVDLLPRLIKGDIDEIDISKIKEGTPARVKILALGGTWIEARVTKIVPFVSTIKDKDRTSEIELRLEAATARPIPVGASADVEVITERKESTLAVPARTVIGKAGQRYTYRSTDGKVVKTPVKTGIGNYARTEILEGLKEGDVVVFPPDDVELKDEMKAKIELQPWP